MRIFTFFGYASAMGLKRNIVLLLNLPKEDVNVGVSSVLIYTYMYMLIKKKKSLFFAKIC